MMTPYTQGKQLFDSQLSDFGTKHAGGLTGSSNVSENSKARDEIEDAEKLEVAANAVAIAIVEYLGIDQAVDQNSGDALLGNQDLDLIG